ncbi:MAG: tyrosine-type recombinase/integrase [Clostridiales bacterium]|nr:tyrosine-type recombinase/integrase [Clostridiales bacterium]
MPIEYIGKIIDILDYLKKTNTRDYLLFSMCFEVGMKLDDVLCLKVSDVRNKKSMTVSGINIKMRKEVIQDIKDYCKDKQKNEFVFQSNDGFNQKLGRKRAVDIMAEVSGMFGIEEFGTDTLRKSFGYFFYLRTRDMDLLKQIYGHSKKYDTLKYIGLKGVVDESSSSN